MNFTITIDGKPVEVQEGMTLLQAARKLGIDIPTLCHLDKCGPLTSCLVCLVKLDGRFVPSCGTKVSPGMAIESETTEVRQARRTALELLFSDHVGDCLAPCNRLCPLRLNVPLMLRQIEHGLMDKAIATVRQALPLAAVLGRLCHHPCQQGCRRGTWDAPVRIREMERFAADTDLGVANPRMPTCRLATGKRVAIVGAGPTGLAAAYFLAQDGHAATLIDRHESAGGSLRAVDPDLLLPDVLDQELALLSRLGILFRFKTKLGRDIALENLLAEFDVVLLATGELPKGEESIPGVPSIGASIDADPDTFRTRLSRLFAAGSAVRPLRQLVKAMAEGKNAAHCISQVLDGKDVRRPAKPFSSLMGRLSGDELKTFVKGANPDGPVTLSNARTRFSRIESASEAARCLHCDCRASGNCALQRYGGIYDVDLARFRGQRRSFEQHIQPGGVVFEPGKCILCGICVRLTELAAEPLGLTFIGRGFNVRVATPFNRTIEQGLQRVAAECVKHCPTGALAFAEKKPSEGV